MNLKQVIQSFIFSYQADASSVYQMWQEANRVKFSRHILGMAASVMFFMIGFDFLVVSENPWDFAAARVIALIYFSGIFGVIYFFQKHPDKKNKKWVDRFLILSAPLIFNAQYFYFNYLLWHQHFQIYYIGFLLVIFYSAFVLHRFRWEQNFFHLTSALLLLLLVWSRPELRDQSYVLLVSHMGSALTFKFFRHDFVSNLHKRLFLLNSLMPSRFAQAAVLASEGEVEDLFKLQYRFTVCLCSDWRNFQEISHRRNISQLSTMLENYYDLIFDQLKKTMPDTHFYFDWSADELFIVFFGDEGADSKVVFDSLHFAKTLATVLFEKIQKQTKGEVIYDIGLSIGKGLVGLQGPKNMKKTTVTGEVPGLAKRFQEEAKLRRQSLPKNTSPLVIMDSELYDFQKKLKVFSADEFQEISGTVKNISGRICYLWVPITPAIKKAS